MIHLSKYNQNNHRRNLTHSMEFYWILYNRIKHILNKNKRNTQCYNVYRILELRHNQFLRTFHIKPTNECLEHPHWTIQSSCVIGGCQWLCVCIVLNRHRVVCLASVELQVHSVDVHYDYPSPQVNYHSNRCHYHYHLLVALQRFVVERLGWKRFHWCDSRCHHHHLPLVHRFRSVHYFGCYSAIFRKVIFSPRNALRYRSMCVLPFRAAQNKREYNWQWPQPNRAKTFRTMPTLKPSTKRVCSRRRQTYIQRHLICPMQWNAHSPGILRRLTSTVLYEYLREMRRMKFIEIALEFRA